jgi:hypothetical protein
MSHKYCDVFAESRGALLDSGTINSDATMKHETPCQRSINYARNKCWRIVGSDVLWVHAEGLSGESKHKETNP